MKTQETIRTWPRMLALVAFVSVLGSPSAFAGTIAFQLISGADTVNVADLLNTGSITYGGSVGDWTVNVSGLGTPYLSAGSMNLSSIGASSSGSPAELTILFSEIDVTKQGSFLFDTLFRNTNTSVRYETYYDLGNTFFAPTTLIQTEGPSSDIAIGGEFYGGAAPGSPYSITQKVIITPINGSTDHSLSGADETVNVPEPSTLLLLVIGGLLCAAAAALRLRLPTFRRPSPMIP